MNLNVEKHARRFFVNFDKKFFSKFFWCQHPEAALRYWPVVAEIKRLKLEKSKILEIGPGSLGIVPYLKTAIDGLDIDFSGPQTKLMSKIKGTADNLLFRKNSYDVVVSVDAFEHLPKDTRDEAVHEMLRVAKKLAVIVVPTGELSEAQDQQLQTHWEKIFGTGNQFLDEHVRYGLPTTDNILVTIDKSLRKLGKRAKIKSFPNLNLQVRNILMRTWITKNRLIYYLYMKGYLLLLPILKHTNFGNCYRTVFVIELANQ